MSYHGNLSPVTCVPENWGTRVPLDNTWMRSWHPSGCFSWLHPGQPLAKPVYLSVCGVFCLFLFRRDWLHSQLLHRQRWLLWPRGTKSCSFASLEGENVARRPPSPWLTILHPSRTCSPQELLHQKEVICVKVMTAWAWGHTSGHVLQHSNRRITVRGGERPMATQMGAPTVQLTKDLQASVFPNRSEFWSPWPSSRTCWISSYWPSERLIGFSWVPAHPGHYTWHSLQSTPHL